MAEMIERVWNGTFCPCGALGKGNEEIRQLEVLMAKNKRNLEEELDEGQKERWTRVLDCFEEYLTLMNAEAFEKGFCAGVRLTAEALLGIPE